METLIYRFGLFRLDAKGRKLKLTKEGKKIPVTYTALRVLLMLMEHAGVLVLKEDLIKEIWGVSGDKGNYAEQKVCELREVLGDNAKDPMYIGTIPREGYLFVFEVRKYPSMEEFNADFGNEQSRALAAKTEEARTTTPQTEVSVRALDALNREIDMLGAKLRAAREVTPETEETWRAWQAKVREARVLEAEIEAVRVHDKELRGFLIKDLPNGGATLNIPDNIIEQWNANLALPKDRRVEQNTVIDLDRFTWSVESVPTHPKSS